MKSLIITKYLLFLAMLMSISAVNSFGQKKGEFDHNLAYNGGEIMLSCFVPHEYDAAKSYKLIVGYHPAGTPSQAMRMMMMPVVLQLGAILVCPNNVDGSNDGCMESIQYMKDNYNIDASNVVMTGYSAGGAPTFSLGLGYYTQFKGIIGIAPAVGTLTPQELSVVDKFPICIIVGDQDGFKGYMDPLVEQIKQANGMVKYVVKPGVGHTGPYFYSQEFNTDWISCYDFIQTAKPKPAAVTLAEPPNSAQQVALPVILNWNAVEGANSYLVHISESASFGTILDSARVTETLYTTNAKIKNGKKYYWRVAGVNEGGEGKWSASWYFTTIMGVPETAPVQYKPTNNSLNVKKNLVTLQWRPVTGVSDYNLQVFEGDAETPFIDENLVYTTGLLMDYELKDLKYFTKYTWQVRCFNEGGYSPWHEQWNFTTEEDLTSADLMSDNGFSAAVLPNPVSESGLINLFVPVDGNIKVQLFTLEGLVIAELFNGMLSVGSHQIAFDASSLNSGMYFIRAISGNSSVTGRVAVIK